MAIPAKICGLSTPETVAMAVDNGAEMIGFVFYPPSPRAIRPDHAAELAQTVPASVSKVGLLVDADDDLISGILAKVDLDYLQLHGSETPARVAEIKHKFSVPTIKAIKVRLREDIDTARDYETVADMLLFDAKAPADMKDALPGGNGIPFDWHLLSGMTFACPWMLSGGLNTENVGAAVAETGAKHVDVSSGVEIVPGQKDIGKIKAFLDAVRAL